MIFKQICSVIKQTVRIWYVGGVSIDPCLLCFSLGLKVCKICKIELQVMLNRFFFLLFFCGICLLLVLIIYPPFFWVGNVFG